MATSTPDSRTPAFDSANSGMIPKATTLCKERSSLSNGALTAARRHVKFVERHLLSLA